MKVIEVTPPKTSFAAKMVILYIESLATVPSPDPTIISPLGKIPNVPTP